MTEPTLVFNTPSAVADQTAQPEKSDADRMKEAIDHLNLAYEVIQQEAKPVIPTPQVLAERFNTGKPELHYVLTFPEALRGIARVTTYGSKKYAPYNYTKGAPASQSVSCALRHLMAWFAGEDIDSESGHSHLDHFIWNAARLAHEMATRPELDDRPHLLKGNGSASDET